MPPPILNAFPAAASPLYEFGEVVQKYPVEWNPVFQCNQLRYQVRCPHCSKVNSHGMVVDIVQHTHGSTVYLSRGCHFCFKDYWFGLAL